MFQTALHWGAKHGNLDLIKLIAGTHKADVNSRTVIAFFFIFYNFPFDVCSFRGSLRHQNLYIVVGECVPGSELNALKSNSVHVHHFKFYFSVQGEWIYRCHRVLDPIFFQAPSWVDYTDLWVPWVIHLFRYLMHYVVLTAVYSICICTEISSVTRDFW